MTVKHVASTRDRSRIAPVALVYAATISTDVSLSDYFYMTLTGSPTLGTPTNPTNRQRVLWDFEATGGPWTITTSAGFKYTTFVPSTTVLTVTSGKGAWLGAVYKSSDSLWHLLGWGTDQ